MIYVCPHCGAKISPKKPTIASKIQGTCPVCKNKVEFVATDGKNEARPKKSNKKMWNIITIIILLIFGCWIVWYLYDDYQTHEIYKRKALEQPYQYSAPYQPSFGGNGRRYDRLKTCTQSCNGGHRCDCKFTKASLEAEGYTRCPKCGHIPDYHH